jgi:hypothetical protein
MQFPPIAANSGNLLKDGTQSIENLFDHMRLPTTRYVRKNEGA